MTTEVALRRDSVCPLAVIRFLEVTLVVPFRVVSFFGSNIVHEFVLR